MMKGFVAGAIGGLIGTWAMSEAQRAWTRAAGDEVPASAGGKHDARDWQARDEHQNSNEFGAQVVARYLIARRLTHDELRIREDVIRHFWDGIARTAMRERSKDHQLIREVTIDCRAAPKIGEECPGDELANSFRRPSVRSGAVCAKPAPTASRPRS
jgi:hypothetical protein